MKAKSTSETTERRAILYCRVSTSEQADSGLGLEAQRSRCEAYAVANGWVIAGVFVDAGVSAKSLERPELQQALDSLEAGDVLVALKLDRLTRTVADLAPLAERIERAGAEWATVAEKYDTGTANGRLMLGMMLQLSQWEREVIGERTAAALSAKRSRRERLGTTPLGYRTDADGRVTVDPDGQRAVARARALRAQGRTLQQIADTLTREGHPTARGGRWAPATIAKLLTPRYLETIGAGA